MWGFTITLGYSRRIMAEAATDQKLGTLLRMHEASFNEWGSCRKRFFTTGVDYMDRHRRTRRDRLERGVPRFRALLGVHAAVMPSLPGTNQGQGGIGREVRRNFLCGLQGREPANLADLNAELRRWVAEVANQRVHGTTHEQVLIRWDGSVRHATSERPAALSIYGRRAAESGTGCVRLVARKSIFSAVAVRRQRGLGSRPRPLRGSSPRHQRIAVHAQAVRHHQVVTLSEHHAGIPLGNKQNGKTLIHIEQSAPVVEHRPLAAYESLATGGAQ